jgi:DNA-binding response OmpR family regulator
MPGDNPNILLLEDTRTVQNYIRDVLRSLECPYQLLAAKRVDEAMNIAEQSEIDLFIVDIGLPDGDGIDFLCAMSAVHPSARALIITSTPNESYKERARALGVLNFLPKPLQRKALLDAVTRLLPPAITEVITQQEESGGFEATIGGLSPADIIQLKCLRRANGAVEFSNEDRFGLVWFEEGEVIHAESECIGSHHSGMEAFTAIVSWRSGNVREVLQAGKIERTIHKSWQALLMDASSADQDSVTA